MNILIQSVSAAVFAAAAVLLWLISVKVLNDVPVKWLCDYDEEPTEKHLGKRFGIKETTPFGIIFGVFGGTCGYMFGLSVYAVFVILIFFVLFMIMLSDIKFTIIPDQFILLLLLISAAFAAYDLLCDNIFITVWWSPLVGAVCGGGVLFLLDFLSILIFKKAGIGFGDIKLFAVLGILFGFPWIFAAAILSVFTAFFHFIYLMIFKKADKEKYLPMGPYICIATALTLLFNGLISSGVGMYLSLLGVQ